MSDSEQKTAPDVSWVDIRVRNAAEAVAGRRSEPMARPLQRSLDLRRLRGSGFEDVSVAVQGRGGVPAMRPTPAPEPKRRSTVAS